MIEECFDVWEHIYKKTIKVFEDTITLTVKDSSEKPSYEIEITKEHLTGHGSRYIEKMTFEKEEFDAFVEAINYIKNILNKYEMKKDYV